MTDYYLDVLRGVYHRTDEGTTACERGVPDRRRFHVVGLEDVRLGTYPKCSGCFEPSAGDAVDDFHDPNPQ